MKLLLIHWVDWVPWKGTWTVNKYICSIFSAPYKRVWILLSILLRFFCNFWQSGQTVVMSPVKKVTSHVGLTMAGHQVLTKSSSPLLQRGEKIQRLLGHLFVFVFTNFWKHSEFFLVLDASCPSFHPSVTLRSCKQSIIFSYPIQKHLKYGSHMFPAVLRGLWLIVHKMNGYFM